MRALAVVVVLVGCTPIEHAFHCAASSQCVRAGVQGSCEATGWCSFPDAGCTPSGRRYGELVGDGLADSCVAADDATTGCVAQLAVGDAHGCALAHDRTVVCWGKNDHGQLGNGATSDAVAAVAVVDDHGVAIGGVTAIAAGAGHTCALRSDGTALCWGDDSAGQLGRGGSAAINSVPAPVALTSIVAIAAGGRHSCAALTTGAVWCWGANDAGQLGTAPSSGASMPVEVVDRAGQTLAASAVAAGATHSCAVARDHTLSCWGSDVDGELGDATNAPTSRPVAALSLGPHVTAAAAGAHFGCTLGDDGRVSCFGLDDRGQAGQPPGTTVAVPTALALDLVTAVAAGGTRACARRAGGQLYCWGDGATAAPHGDGVVAVAVGAGDLCVGRVDAVACDRFGDPRVACK